MYSEASREGYPPGPVRTLNRPRLKILVVDDDEVILKTAEEILRNRYEIYGCVSGEEAFGIAESEKPSLILLDINLMGISGFEVLEGLKKNGKTRDIPVIFITADEDRDKEAMGLKNGAHDFIRKPFVPEVLLQRSRRIIELDRFQKGLQGEVKRQTLRGDRLTKEMMIALSHTVDAKDHYTNGHSERVAAYSAEIARRMGKSQDEQLAVYATGLLHDIGKIGISEDIINKTEKLTRDEFGEIKEHTKIGYEILKGITDMPTLAVGARSHHEKYDGSGYPDGLKGQEIPEIARIICVADCYDAMTSTRTYSNPRKQAEVRAEIVRCSGAHFDPEIAGIFLSMIDDDTSFIMNERTGGRKVWKGGNLLWSGNAAYEEESSAEISSKPEALPSWLKDIPGLSADKGIENCGSVKSFLSVLTTFHQTAATRADELEKLYLNGNFADYTTRVHALKSSARIIGADGLSEMAREMEEAGKKGREDLIREKTEELLFTYRRLNERLTPLFTSDGKKKEMTPTMQHEAFQTIGEIAESCDYGLMEELVRDLKGYELSGESKEALQKIEKMLTELDWDGIVQEAQRILEQERMGK